MHRVVGVEFYSCEEMPYFQNKIVSGVNIKYIYKKKK